MDSTASSLAGRQTIRLRALTGHDERALDRADSRAAMELIARTSGSQGDGALSQAQVASMTAFERDRALAEVYIGLYGDSIESTLRCNVCGKPFDIKFNLVDLMKQRQPDALTATALGDGTFRMPDGLRFRLPCGEDELSVLHLSANEAVRELLLRCVLEAPAGADPAAVEEAMEQVAPILDADIASSCPECGAAVQVRFDLQAYLLQSILQDRRRLWRETHMLASAYKWSLDEIHSLTRADRRTLVSMIEADSARRLAV
jgi:hypothetical protein